MNMIQMQLIEASNQGITLTTMYMVKSIENVLIRPKTEPIIIPIMMQGSRPNLKLYGRF